MAASTKRCCYGQCLKQGPLNIHAKPRKRNEGAGYRMEPEKLIKGKKKLGLTEYFAWAKHYTGCFFIIQLNLKIMLT